jgi:hypothetical protein
VRKVVERGVFNTVSTAVSVPMAALSCNLLELAGAGSSPAGSVLLRPLLFFGWVCSDFVVVRRFPSPSCPAPLPSSVGTLYGRHVIGIHTSSIFTIYPG